MSTLEKAVALSLQLKTANSAFQANPGGETARILREMAEALDIGVEGYFKLLDINGNTVGNAYFSLWEDDEEEN
jgi:hypothetical protein